LFEPEEVHGAGSVPGHNRDPIRSHGTGKKSCISGEGEYLAGGQVPRLERLSREAETACFPSGVTVTAPPTSSSQTELVIFAGFE